MARVRRKIVFLYRVWKTKSITIKYTCNEGSLNGKKCNIEYEEEPIKKCDEGYEFNEDCNACVKCSKCNTKNIIKATYCKKCGTKFTKKEQEFAYSKTIFGKYDLYKKWISRFSIKFITGSIVFKIAILVIILGFGI